MTKNQPLDIMARTLETGGRGSLARHLLDPPQPPSLTGCEYHLLLRSQSEATSGVSSYDNYLLPVRNQSINQTFDVQILYSLEKHQLLAIQSILQQRNSYNTHDGQWVVADLSIIDPARALGVVIQFLRYSAPPSGGIEISRKLQGNVLGEIGERRDPEKNFNGNGDLELVRPCDTTKADAPSGHVSRRFNEKKATPKSNVVATDNDGQPEFRGGDSSFTFFPPESTRTPSLDSEPASHVLGPLVQPTPLVVTSRAISKGSTSDTTATDADQLVPDREPASTERRRILAPNFSDKDSHASGDRDTIIHPTSPLVSPSQLVSRESTSSNIALENPIAASDNSASESTKARPMQLKIHSNEYLKLKDCVIKNISEEQWEEVKLPLRRMLKIQDETLAALEKEKFQTMHDLAAAHREVWDWDKAIGLYIPTLEGRIRVHGENHKDTLQTMYNLADCYYENERHDDAQPLFRRCLQGRLKTLGENHIDTLEAMYNLAHSYKSGDRRQEAAKLFKHCLEVQRKVLGQHHEDTLWTAYALAQTYEELNLFHHAETVYKYWYSSSSNNSLWKTKFGEGLASLYQSQSYNQKAKEIIAALKKTTS